MFHMAYFFKYRNQSSSLSNNHQQQLLRQAVAQKSGAKKNSIPPGLSRLWTTSHDGTWLPTADSHLHLHNNPTLSNVSVCKRRLSNRSKNTQTELCSEWRQCETGKLRLIYCRAVKAPAVYGCVNHPPTVGNISGLWFIKGKTGSEISATAAKCDDTTETFRRQVTLSKEIPTDKREQSKCLLPELIISRPTSKKGPNSSRHLPLCCQKTLLGYHFLNNTQLQQR